MIHVLPFEFEKLNKNILFLEQNDNQGIKHVTENEYQCMGRMDGCDAWRRSGICLRASAERISGI